MSNLIDLKGQKFGKLTVIERAENKGKNTRWLCLCECGNKTIVHAISLRSGSTKSCGCYKSIAPKLSNTKHGMSHTTTHKIWCDIKSRCFCLNDPAYKNYGGRGITMCDRWKNSFEAFYEDVSKLPHFNEKGFTLDRIDNDGNYEPNNVRWVDRITQGNNKRNNRLISYNGETHTMAEWAKIKGLNYKTLSCRLYDGWDISRALETQKKL